MNAYRSPRRFVTQDTFDRMNELADLMADDCPSISEASRRMDVSQQRANQLWQRVRSDLGAQAV